MKALLISHTYVAEANQRKLVELSGCEDLDLTLVIPRKWEDTLKTYHLKKVHDENFNIIPLKALLDGRISLYFYPRLHKLFHRLRPDIVHIEEEPWALSAFQAMEFKKIWLY